MIILGEGTPPFQEKTTLEKMTISKKILLILFQTTFESGGGGVVSISLPPEGPLNSFRGLPANN